MSDQVNIRVKAEFPHDTARVGGINFSKLQPTAMQVSECTDEILKSEILDVQPYEEPKTPKVSEKHADKSAVAAVAPDSEIGKAGVKPRAPKGG